MLKDTDDEDDTERKLRLKGQMIYVSQLISFEQIKIHLLFSIKMDNWRLIMFLGTPVMPKLSSLISTGLYINDLSMHDFSR